MELLEEEGCFSPSGTPCLRGEGHVDSSKPSLLDLPSWSSHSEGGVDTEMRGMSYSEIMDNKISSL